MIVEASLIKHVSAMRVIQQSKKKEREDNFLAPYISMLKDADTVYSVVNSPSVFLLPLAAATA